MSKLTVKIKTKPQNNIICQDTLKIVFYFITKTLMWNWVLLILYNTVECSIQHHLL